MRNVNGDLLDRKISSNKNLSNLLDKRFQCTTDSGEDSVSADSDSHFFRQSGGNEEIKVSVHESNPKKEIFGSMHLSKAFTSKASSSSVLTFGNNESMISGGSESLGINQLFPRKRSRKDFTDMPIICQEPDAEKDKD